MSARNSKPSNMEPVKRKYLTSGIAVHRGLVPDTSARSGIEREKMAIVPVVENDLKNHFRKADRRETVMVPRRSVADKRRRLFTRPSPCRRANSRGAHALGS